MKDRCHRLTNQNAGHDDCHRRIQVRDNHLRRRILQNQLGKERKRNAHAADGILLPQIDLRLDRRRIELPGKIFQRKQNQKAQKANHHLIHSNAVEIYRVAALQDNSYIRPDHGDDNEQQNPVFHNQKDRFKLRISVRMLFRDRLVQKRYQNKKGSQQNQIRNVEDSIHQNGIGMKYDRHCNFGNGKKRTAQKRKSKDSLFLLFPACNRALLRRHINSSFPDKFWVPACQGHRQIHS